MSSGCPEAAVASVPCGAWAVAVSGGGDSVALLSLLRPRVGRGGLSAHVVHLDHQTRGAASTADAAFVRGLASRWGLPCTVAKREEVEVRLREARGGSRRLPANASARYRAVRLALFREVVQRHALAGVILAHHADDQAETVLHRLLRGSGYAGLAGMDAEARLGTLLVCRPLLRVRRDALRRHLQESGEPWREDESNEWDDYLRNRLRRVLRAHPALADDLLRLSDACRAARDWARSAAPRLGATFGVGELASLPPVLARESASRWLTENGVSQADLSPAVVDRLVALCRDAGTPSRQDFPGRVSVRRRGGTVAAASDPVQLPVPDDIALEPT